eukprot:7220536-Pyramimonas_sp.AAC.1
MGGWYRGGSTLAVLGAMAVSWQYHEGAYRGGTVVVSLQCGSIRRTVPWEVVPWRYRGSTLEAAL